MESLRLKAEAFSNQAWSEYWAAYGPSLLVRGWVSVYPHVPLEQLHRVCALECLAQAMEQLGLEGGDGESNGMSRVIAGTSESVLREGSEMLNASADDTTQEIVVSDGGMAEEGNGADVSPPSSPSHGHASSAAPTDEEVARLWSEHYNSYYWYCYQVFCQCEEEGENGGGEMGNGESVGGGEVGNGGDMEEVGGMGEEVGGEGGEEMGNGGSMEEGEVGDGGDVEEGVEGGVEGEVVSEFIDDAIESVVDEVVATVLDPPPSSSEGGGADMNEVGGAVGEDRETESGRKRQAFSDLDKDQQAEAKR